MSINRVILVGFVGKDPEIRKTNNEAEVAFFNLATSSSWKDKTSGEKQEKTEWHRVVVFSPGLVNLVKNHVKKGSKLFVEGALQTRKWIDKSGIDRYVTEVVLNGFNAEIELYSNQSKTDSVNSYEDTPEFSVSFADEEAMAIDNDIPF